MSKRKDDTDGATKLWQKQEMVLTAEERELVDLFRRAPSRDTRPILGYLAASVRDDAEKRQRDAKSRFRVITGGRPQ